MKLSRILFVLFLTLTLVACGGGDAEPEPAAQPTPVAENTAPAPEATTLVQDAALVETPAADKAVPTETPAPSAEETAAPAPVAELNEDYEDALTVKNQLILGTIRLEGTDQAISAEQAAELIPYWQVYRSLTESGTAATEETDAVQNQIIELMHPEQIAAIAALQLTNVDLQDFYVEIGVKEERDPSLTPEADATGVPMRDLSPEAKATAQAERGVVPQNAGSGRGVTMLDEILALLESK